MTINNADDFYDIIVEPICSQYLNNFPGAIAQAVNACMAIYHMGDWYAVQKGMDAAQKKQFYTNLANDHPYISYAGQIINCSKHADRPNPVKLKQEREEVTDPVNDTIFMSLLVVAEMPDGKRYDVREIISNGYVYWKRQLGRLT
jgi:hypothetical protein